VLAAAVDLVAGAVKPLERPLVVGEDEREVAGIRPGVVGPHQVDLGRGGALLEPDRAVGDARRGLHPTKPKNLVKRDAGVDLSRCDHPRDVLDHGYRRSPP
jgi:hypothetical protein